MSSVIIQFLFLICILGLSLTQVPTIKNCKVANGNKCQECNTGYWVNEDGSCSENCKSPCKTCKKYDSVSCESCVGSFPAYFLSSSSCLKCPEGCLDCISSSQCTTCSSSGFYKDTFSQTCKACSATNCIKCTGPDSCDTCNLEYARTETTVSGKKSITCTKVSGLATTGMGILMIISILFVTIYVLICASWIICIFFCAKSASHASHPASYEIQPATVVVYDEAY